MDRMDAMVLMCDLRVKRGHDDEVKEKRAAMEGGKKQQTRWSSHDTGPYTYIRTYIHIGH